MVEVDAFLLPVMHDTIDKSTHVSVRLSETLIHLTMQNITFNIQNDQSRFTTKVSFIFFTNQFNQNKTLR